MYFETALNLLWVLVAMCALGLLSWYEIRRRRVTAWTTRAARMLAVLFAVLFLFPCVSESDDLLSLQNLQFTVDTGSEVGNPLPSSQDGERPGAQLVRFFESLQQFQIIALYGLLLSLLFVAFVVVPPARDLERRRAAESGRAPPAFALV